MGLSIIAACLPTLMPLFRDLSAKEISQQTRKFFKLGSRSSQPMKSASETQIVRKIGAENNVGVESVAMGNFECESGEERWRSEELDGHIFVTTGMSRRSSLHAV